MTDPDLGEQEPEIEIEQEALPWWFDGENIIAPGLRLDVLRGMNIAVETTNPATAVAITDALFHWVLGTTPAPAGGAKVTAIKGGRV